MIGHGADQSPDGRTMTKKRMVIEIGMGTDIRGADSTKAACRAVRDALWHNSLSIATALGHPLDAMIVDVHIGVPPPRVGRPGAGHGRFAARKRYCDRRRRRP